MKVSKIKDSVAEDVPIHSYNRRVDRSTVCVGRQKLDCCCVDVFLRYELSCFEEPARLCSPKYTAWVLCPAHHGRDSITGQNLGKYSSLNF